jgi:hydrogenase small subunit
MNVPATSRRDFLKTAGRITALWGLSPALIPTIAEAVDNLESGAAPVLWLQGSNCSGCSVSLVNSYPLMPVSLLTRHISLKFHQTLSTAQGELAVQVVNETISQGGYVLVVEGAVPAGMPKACTFGGETFPDQLARAAAVATHVVAIGTCACFGGIPASGANPIGAVDVAAFLTTRGISKPLVRVPGCPPHPDWMIGTLVHVLKLGLPALDAYQRPKKFFGRKIHDTCPYRDAEDAKNLGSLGCMEELGCRGPDTYGDCIMRGWNNTSNNCIFTHTPCIGCTQPNFARNTRFFSPTSQ